MRVVCWFESRQPALRTLLAAFTEIDIDRAIAERAGRIRRHTGIRIADALIAATALERSLTLVTRNVRAFEKASGLRLQSSP